jgi:REP element-mobilizing transposase RayT
MPDRPRGFVRRGQGILPPDAALAGHYRQDATQTEATFDGRIQSLLIAEVQAAAFHQGFRTHFVATEPTHVHVLVSWRDDRGWLKVRTGLKASLSRCLNRQVQQRTWLVDNASRKRVKDREHFDYLVTQYLPAHGGWKWREAGPPFL